MFENIMRGITHALCEYGMWSAGLFSAHGMYEEKSLRNSLLQMKQKNSIRPDLCQT